MSAHGHRRGLERTLMRSLAELRELAEVDPCEATKILQAVQQAVISMLRPASLTERAEGRGQ